jgi:hypothetical protein
VEELIEQETSAKTYDKQGYAFYPEDGVDMFLRKVV